MVGRSGDSKHFSMDGPNIMLKRLCNMYALKPHFYIVKLESTGYIFFYFALKHKLWVHMTTAIRSNEYQQYALIF